METKLLDLFLKIILFVFFVLGAAVKSYAQTTLSPGDVTVVTVNADSPDNFDFVPLVNLQSGTTIYFTDNAYVSTDDKLRDNEGTVKYVAPSEIQAGTVISYSGSDGNGFTETSGSYNISVSGDNLIVYQVNSDTTYLFGVGWAKGPSTVWSYDDGSTANNRSDIPPGLSEADNTILNLGTTDNYQYDAGYGVEGTASSLLTLVGDPTHWKDNDSNPFEPFATSFKLIDPPTIGFSSQTSSGDEGAIVNLTVKLVEANTEAVDVNVAFLGNSSSAEAADFDGGYSTQTVSFSASDPSGTTKSIQLPLKNDGDFEGTEKAVFQLEDNSNGSIISPNTATLTIHDKDAPNVVINELLPDPSGHDVNHDQVQSNREDEFVEIVNNESSDIDISNWTISDAKNVSYTFPSGTILPSNRAIIVFGGGNPSGNFGGAEIFTSGGLSLNNTDETVTLKDQNGNQIDQVTYGSTTEGVSLNRNPDGTGSTFSDHDKVASAKGNYSPGTKVDGTPFGSRHAIGIRGNEGWRMIASPVQDATFDDFFKKFWMQGLTNSDDPAGDPTIAYWNESADSFQIPGGMNDKLQAGRGYIVYFFQDDEFRKSGIQGGFPKVVHTNKKENPSTVSVNVSATDKDNSGSIEGNEGWNLLGNPFDTDISVTALKSALEKVNGGLDADIYIWDNEKGDGNGGYRTLTDGDLIAPFQAFFVRFGTTGVNGTVDLNKSALEANQGKEFYKSVSESDFRFNLELHGDQYYDTYYVEFGDKGSTDLNKYDAYKLFSLNPNSINLFSSLKSNKLQKKVLPKKLASTFEIPLSFDASGRSSLTFQWNGINSLPDGWKVSLLDKEMNREIDLSSSKEYQFSVSDVQTKLKNGQTATNKLLNNTKSKNKNPRFVLSIQPKLKQARSTDLPESAKLNPNYPNPFNPTTRVSYEVNKKSKVQLTIWNMIGQKVATLVDGVVDAGTHEEIWNASNMPSGIYIARFQVEGKVFTRKMTLIK